jgi:hypothetical protein
MESFISHGGWSEEVVGCGVNKFIGFKDLVEKRYVYVDTET